MGVRKGHTKSPGPRERIESHMKRSGMSAGKCELNP